MISKDYGVDFKIGLNWVYIIVSFEAASCDASAYILQFLSEN